LIKKNPFYQADIHPKFLISNNQVYFDRIYSMLSEKYIKDISNYNIAQVLIKKNPFYQADIHPKFLISNN